MTDFPGTQPAFVDLIDGIPPAGDPYQANQMNVAYHEIMALAAHLGAGTIVAAKGGIRLTLIDVGSAAVVGYVGQVAAKAITDTPVTIIPGGTWDVAAVLLIIGVVKVSDGEAGSIMACCKNDESVMAYTLA